MARSTTTPHALGTERIETLLRRYALPAIIATSSSSLYNIVDSIFVGRGVDPLAISSVALAMPLMNIASAFGAMVGIGAASHISLRLGAGDRPAAAQTLGNVVLLNLLIGAAFMVVGLWLLDPILYLFGASEATIGYARDFMRILLSATIISHMHLSLNEVMRATGYPRRAMAIMLAAVALNCALNPLFIFGLGWGIRGSAWATVLSQAVALALSVAHFTARSSFLRFEQGIFRLRRAIVRRILAIGTAPFLLHLCASVVVILVNRSLGRYGGDEAIGAYGIVYRVVMLFLTIVAGLNQGMQPLVGYNYGAEQYDRMRRALRLTIGCAVAVTTCGFLLGELFSRQVAMLFVDRTDGAAAERMIAAAAEGLRIVLLVFPMVGFQIVTSNFFQYIGRPRQAIFLSLTRQMLFLVPLLLLLPPWLGVRGVWISMPLADGSASLLAALLLYRSLRRMPRG